jgi:DNA-binding SARP family transcriptional activator
MYTGPLVTTRRDDLVDGRLRPAPDATTIRRVKAASPGDAASVSSELPRVQVHLLGPPRIEVDGQPGRSPRGRKAWGLLAFLLLNRAPATREQLAGLLFADADDPLGAVRWNLAELRRSLSTAVRLAGDPVELDLAADAFVDVHALGSATWHEAVRVPGLGRELLEGIDLVADPAFEAWLLAERRHVAALSAAVLHEAATARLAAGRADQAVDLATRLVALDSFDEDAHALLARAYVAAGAVAQARAYVETTGARLRRELGTEPTAALLGAVDTALTAPRAGPQWVRSTGAVESLISAGEAAVAAGVLQPGFEILRRSVADAREIGDRELEARALVTLGTALVHGARGNEGADPLHAALAIATELDAHAITTEATRELGYIELKHARYERAAAWLGRSVELAPDRNTRAAAIAVLGAVRSDQGSTGPACALLAEAESDAHALDKPRLEAWSSAFLGRSQLLREEWDAARASLTRSLDVARAAGWITFRAYPQALLGAVELATGEVAAAKEAFESAFALGCQIGDPCWEGLSARGIGLIHAHEGRSDEAIAWLDDARTRCVRTSDAYLWVHAYCIDALCEVAIARGHPQAASWVGDLEMIAARSGMYELLVRADLHRVALGEHQAGEVARLFAGRIDNPAVLRRVASLEPALVAP